VKVARLQLPELATPVVALCCDGAHYDVATLERLWRAESDGSDFFARVIASGSAGLAELHARLANGRRPTEARIRDGECLPLPPCDDTRSAYLQLAPAELRGDAPRFHHRDARAFVGDAQPVAVWTGSLAVEVGLAIVLGDDLERACEREARRAVLAWTLLIDWTIGDAWERDAPQPPSQLGPALCFRPRLEEVLEREIVLTVSGTRRTTSAIRVRAFSITECLAYLSHHVALRAGDVIGTGCVVGGRERVRVGEQVNVEVPGVMALSGFSVRAPEAATWRAS
jgi:hypothetical protein